MNKLSAVSQQKAQLVKKENRKRISFLLKLLLVAGLIYTNIRYDYWISFFTANNPDLAVPVARVFRALLFILTSNLLISLARIILVAVYIRQRSERSRESNVVLAINRIATLLNITVIVVGGFLLFELEWNDFFSTFSLVAVATVLLTKDYISNTVNGLINMMSDQLALGDRVKIGAHEGTIKDITLSNVYLEDEEENHIIIPNNTVFAADVINYNQQKGELIEVPVELHPDAVGDITEWETQIKESLQPFHSHTNIAKVKVRLQGVSADKVQLAVQFRSKTSSPSRKKEMIHTILQQFITARTSSLKKD
ncbi:mechanosensitive ion channel family protein [Tunicatimonas pelagia]|uniref:mechanosensitive ion channel family protein n=1 Tax=Tunicatimonas pelagia TaxID=931531 RepID=UPI002664FBC9|nr:mechanosensitive ion channel domain-containing protein [Tunicatimonas pelagia]WKN45967.1 mechanosensitive ion channel [Tunicatimonas pelagia]